MKHLFRGLAVLMCTLMCLNPTFAYAKDVVSTNESTSISANVGGTQAVYSVNFPSSISFGNFTEIKDTYVPYTVTIKMENTDGGVLSVTTADEGYFYLNGDENSTPLKFTNTFGTMKFTGDSTVTAYLKVSAEDLANAVKGNYQASLIVTSKFLTAEEAAEDSATSTTTTKKSSTTKKTTTTSDDETTSYTAKLSVRKSDSFSTESMCNALFYQNAYMEVTDDETKVTVYVIDPIPNYSDTGVPLSKIKVKTSSKTVSASLSSSNRSTKYFGYSAMFIPKEGNYTCDPITFTVPFDDVKNSSSKTLLMSAYVTAMGSTQSFYLVFSGITEGTTATDDALATSDDEETEDEETETESTSTSSSSSGSSSGNGDALKEGTYQVKVGALKSDSNESSMMAQYMYGTGDLTVTEDQCKLTVYIEHTVAGKSGGGPKYIKYNGTSAEKVSNAKSIDGVAYDSFTITTDNPIASILPVDMYINAAKMSVSCRITVDLSGIEAAGDEEATIDEETTPLAKETASESLLGKIKAQSLFIKIILSAIGVFVAGLLAYLFYLWNKKRNIY